MTKVGFFITKFWVSKQLTTNTNMRFLIQIFTVSDLSNFILIMFYAFFFFLLFTYVIDPVGACRYKLSDVAFIKWLQVFTFWGLILLIIYYSLVLVAMLQNPVYCGDGNHSDVTITVSQEIVKPMATSLRDPDPLGGFCKGVAIGAGFTAGASLVKNTSLPLSVKVAITAGLGASGAVIHGAGAYVDGAKPTAENSGQIGVTVNKDNSIETPKSGDTPQAPTGSNFSASSPNEELDLTNLEGVLSGVLVLNGISFCLSFLLLLIFFLKTLINKEIKLTILENILPEKSYLFFIAILTRIVQMHSKLSNIYIFLLLSIIIVDNFSCIYYIAIVLNNLDLFIK